MERKKDKQRQFCDLSPDEKVDARSSYLIGLREKALEGDLNALANLSHIAAFSDSQEAKNEARKLESPVLES